MTEVAQETQETIERLQGIEQTMQALLGQKQQFQSQLIELESALTELESAPKAYKIVGGIMVEAAPEALKAEVSSKKDIMMMRIGSIEKQEKMLKEKAKALQEDVMQTMKKR